MTQPMSTFYWIDGNLYRRYIWDFPTNKILWLTRIDPQTKLGLVMQSAVIQDGIGQMGQTMKLALASHEDTRHFWAEYQRICRDELAVRELWAEMPADLAEHYLTTYEGLSLSGEVGGDGLTVLRCRLTKE